MPEETMPLSFRDGFAAEVISGCAPSSRPGAIELRLRLLQGKPTCGPAKLVKLLGAAHTLTILGVTHVTYSHPEEIEPGVIYLGVSGVALDVIQPGQRLLQEVFYNLG